MLKWGMTSFGRWPQSWGKSYSKLFNEEEGWTRAMAKVGKRYTFYNHCLRIIGCNFLDCILALNAAMNLTTFI